MKLQQRLAQFMQAHNVSQNQVAKGIGKSAAAVNQWLQGKYAGDNDALEQLIGAYLSREQGRLAVSRLAKQWVETATAKMPCCMGRRAWAKPPRCAITPPSILMWC